MKNYIAGVDGKPCIWPAPSECIWNMERYRIRECLKISLPDEFIPEAGLFAESAYGLGVQKTEFIETYERAGIKAFKCSIDELGSEGYILEIGETGITIKAGTSRGIFYAFQTLLQLLENSPGLSVCGVKIKDRPANETRRIVVRLEKTVCIDTFKRFIDFAARYKINSIIIEAAENFDYGKLNGLTEYINKRHMDTELVKGNNGESGNCTGGAVSYAEGAGSHANAVISGSPEENVYRVIKLSHELWRTGNITGDAPAMPLSEDFMKVALQLYPGERDRINKAEYPSGTGRSFKTIELRSFYNAPLHRLSWRPGDYDFMYLADAPFIPNAAPFSIFQGVNDFKLEHSMVLSGDRLNNGIYNIPIGGCLKSLLFLHSYIDGRKDMPAADDINPDLKVVGYYNITYRGGETEKVEIIFGKTISFRKFDPASYYTAYQANPVFAGKTWYGDFYILYSQEWINPKPDLPVEKVDLLPAEGMEENGIALFGITAVS